MKKIFTLVVALFAANAPFADTAYSKQVTLIGSSSATCAPNGMIYFNLQGEVKGTPPRNFMFYADNALAKVWLSKLETAMSSGQNITVVYTTVDVSCITTGNLISEMQLVP